MPKSKNKVELETLLSSIQEGLKKFTITELNEAIISFLTKKGDKSIEIHYVLEIVAEEYSISPKSLLAKNARGNLQEAKQLCYSLLYFNLGLSLRYISSRIFFNNHNSVAIGVKRIKKADINHVTDKVLIEKYERLEQKLLSNFAKLTTNNL
jgi:chromosomal replication initiation ATPase DnaA